MPDFATGPGRPTTRGAVEGAYAETDALTRASPPQVRADQLPPMRLLRLRHPNRTHRRGDSVTDIDLSMEYPDGRKVPITLRINDEAVAKYREIEAAYEAAVAMFGPPTITIGDVPPDPPSDTGAAIRSLLEAKPDPALAAAVDSMIKGAAEWQAKFDTEFTQKVSASAVRWRDRPWWRKFLGLKAAGEL